MKSTCVVIALLLAGISQALAQGKPVNLSDSAYYYYQKKDFAKAFLFYHTYYSDTSHSPSNYDAYYAAVAACHAGHPEQIGHYLEMSARVGYAVTDYPAFAGDPLNACMRDKVEWKKFIGVFKSKADSAAAVLKAVTDSLNDRQTRVNQSILSDPAFASKLAKQKSAAGVLNLLQHFNQYPDLKSTGHWTLYHLRANDTLTVPFLCYIPLHYDHRQKAPLYVFLHGAAAGPKVFTNPAYEPANERKLFKRVFDQNAFILFPFSKKSYNWLEHTEAFETILQELAYLKSLYNIDDNKVYLGGHSDGGRGAVWFAMNRQTPFAAFFGICYFPSLLTGNTHFRNMHNLVPFYGISAINDKLFPLNTVQNITQQAVQAGGNWRYFATEGTHGLPYRSPKSVYFIFDSLITKVRDPLPQKIVWETDDIKNGRYYWITIDRLDTAKRPAAWHTNLSPSVTGKSGSIKFTKRKSVAFSANVANNVITVSSSCVRAMTIHLMNGLIDIKKPVTIHINGRKRFSALIRPDKNLMISEFLRTKDRTQILIRNLRFEL